MSVGPLFLDLLHVLAVLDGVRVDLGIVSGGGGAVDLLTECRQVAGGDIRCAAVIGGAPLTEDAWHLLHLDVPLLHLHQAGHGVAQIRVRATII